MWYHSQFQFCFFTLTKKGHQTANMNRACTRSLVGKQLAEALKHSYPNTFKTHSLKQIEACSLSLADYYRSPRQFLNKAGWHGTAKSDRRLAEDMADFAHTCKREEEVLQKASEIRRLKFWNAAKSIARGTKSIVDGVNAIPMLRVLTGASVTIFVFATIQQAMDDDEQKLREFRQRGNHHKQVEAKAGTTISDDDQEPSSRIVDILTSAVKAIMTAGTLIDERQAEQNVERSQEAELKWRRGTQQKESEESAEVAAAQS
jgi:hypothetical protein